MGAQAIGGFTRIQNFLQLSVTPDSAISARGLSENTDACDSQEKTAGQIPVPLVEQQNPHEDHQMDHEPKSDPLLYFTPNYITAITGPVGCGKSTALRALLSAEEGQQSFSSPSDNIAYCSQTPWIYEGTIRDNIIGQSSWDDTSYKSVIRVCELDGDLDRMPEGDATAVGSGGLKLSGGERQRIVSNGEYSLTFED